MEEPDHGRNGYTPACGNEWRVGVCEKPRIKCGECSNRLLIPLTDAVIYEHLTGKRTVGVYPLLSDDTCHFLAADFDDAEWQEDANGFCQSCQELGVPVALEISRSGKGAHAWIFFSGSVSARDARRLGTAIISHTCARTRQLKLESYDRLFPNQDSMPKGGFGNMIANTRITRTNTLCSTHQYPHAPIESCDPGCDCTTRHEAPTVLGRGFLLPSTPVLAGFSAEMRWLGRCSPARFGAPRGPDSSLFSI